MADTANLLWKTASPVFICMSTVGNLLCIVVLTRPNNRKSSTAIFLIALAVSDLIVIYTGLLRWWLIHLTGTDVRHFGDAVCRLHVFLIYASTQTSSWLLVAVTCERIISTKWPHKVKVICTRRSATYTVFIVYLVIYGGSAHLLYGTELRMVNETGNDVPVLRDTCNVKTQSNSDLCNRRAQTISNDSDRCLKKIIFENNSTVCDTDAATQSTDMCNITKDRTVVPSDSCSRKDCNCSRSQSEDHRSSVKSEGHLPEYKCAPFADSRYKHFFYFIYPWIDLVLYFLFPAIILGIGDIVIIHKIVSSRQLRQSMMQYTSRNVPVKQLSDKSISITVMLLTVNAVFILCTTPVTIYLIGIPYWVDKQHGFNDAQAIIWATVNLLMYLNHSVNFILYCLSGSRFRTKLKETFKRGYKSHIQHNSSTGSVSESFRARMNKKTKGYQCNDNTERESEKSLKSVMTEQSIISTNSGKDVCSGENGFVLSFEGCSNTKVSSKLETLDDIALENIISHV